MQLLFRAVTVYIHRRGVRTLNGRLERFAARLQETLGGLRVAVLDQVCMHQVACISGKGRNVQRSRGLQEIRAVR